VGLAVLVLLFLYLNGFLGRGTRAAQLQVLQFLPFAVGLIVGITVHEFSHGLVATFFGDDLPRRVGRLTLNPLKHLDPMGTLLILIPPHFGWGKPMPINPAAMRNPGIGWAMSSLAGPVSNLIVATVVAALFQALGDSLDALTASVLVGVVVVNVSLAIFNLVPLPPLDGFGFVFGLSPGPIRVILSPLWNYGPMLLLALLFLPAVVPGFPPFLQEVIGAGRGFVLSTLGFGSEV